MADILYNEYWGYVRGGQSHHCFLLFSAIHGAMVVIHELERICKDICVTLE
jgi:hypothetical protein